MTAANHKITIEQGSTFTQVLTWKAGATVETATPVDLSGCTARMQIRALIDDPDPALVSLTTANGGITLGGAFGTVTILITATQTAALTFESAVYDLEIIMSDAVTVHRLVYGCVVLKPEVTR